MNKVRSQYSISIGRAVIACFSIVVFQERNALYIPTAIWLSIQLVGTVETASALLPVWDEVSALLCDRSIPSSHVSSRGRKRHGCTERVGIGRKGLKGELAVRWEDMDRLRKQTLQIRNHFCVTALDSLRPSCLLYPSRLTDSLHLLHGIHVQAATYTEGWHQKLWSDSVLQAIHHKRKILHCVLFNLWAGD